MEGGDMRDMGGYKGDQGGYILNPKPSIISLPARRTRFGCLSSFKSTRIPKGPCYSKGHSLYRVVLLFRLQG